ncbi:MAG TPA: hypothetical protein P5096_00245 [Patescibacteria group bacterium]|nr:hypothetical protein [Patescibacteria group bacterium]
MTEKNELDEIKEEVEEVKEIVEEIIAVEKEKEVDAKNESGKEGRKSKTTLAWLIAIGIVILGVIVFLSIQFGLFSKLGASLNRNKYGFDFNYNKVRSVDWDSLLTKKKIARAIDVPNKNINMLKNPDQNQVLEDPKALSESQECISILDEKFLNEMEQEKNLINVTISLCKTKSEAEKLYSERHDGTKNASAQDSSISIKKFDDIKIGNKAYTYLITKTATAEGETNTNYSGLSLLRGPFVVIFEEQEQTGVTKISSEEMKMKLAKYIDAQLKNSLTAF